MKQMQEKGEGSVREGRTRSEVRPEDEEREKTERIVMGRKLMKI